MIHGLRPASCRTLSLALGTAVGLAVAAAANPPAALAPPASEDARATFERFAARWMERVRRLGAERRQRPTLQPGSGGPLVTYRSYGDDFSLELRPTGRPASPYVGILRYTEHVYRCAELEAADCTVASSTPVTEVFRFQGGRWVY